MVEGFFKQGNQVFMAGTTRGDKLQVFRLNSPEGLRVPRLVSELEQVDAFHITIDCCCNS